MKALWIPIFSMRSYETGQYAILKDGNFQLTLARVLASDFEHIDLVVPEDASDWDEATKLIEEMRQRHANHRTIRLTRFKYGQNAVETRRKFWVLNAMTLGMFESPAGADVLITDITGYDGELPVVYNFNITKLPELNRPYIDEFFELDLQSIEQSLFTTVLNPRQREYILECRPDLLDKVMVNFKCAHERLLPEVIERDVAKRIVFWPFRISDKAYQFEQFIEAFDAQGLDEEFFIIATDPNDTLKTERVYISKERLSKTEYYAMLANRPLIVMLDDIDTVLHPGTIEFFHYGCPVITFKSELIHNPNAIENLDQLSSALHHPVYNAVDARPFVYAADEIDPLYNSTFVNVRNY